MEGEGSRRVRGFALLTARRLRIEDMFVWGIYMYNRGWWGVMSFFVRGRVVGFVERDATIGTIFGRIWCVGPCAVLIFPLKLVRLRCDAATILRGSAFYIGIIYDDRDKIVKYIYYTAIELGSYLEFRTANLSHDVTLSQ